MDKEKILKQYGFSEKETEVYLKLLPLGCVNLQEIAKRTELPRTTTYNTLNHLTQKGLVSHITKKGVRFYEAAEPKKLLEKLKEKENLLNSVLPELESLKKTLNESSSVEIYQGQKGLFTILADVFKKKQQTYYFGSYSLSKEILKHQPEHFRNIRLERKIPAKIVIDEYEEKTFKKQEYKKITEIRYNNTLKDFPCMIFIYGNKVAIYTLKKDLIGLIIKNEQVAEAMKFIFYSYWNNSQKN